jgi:hypothetical protein
LRFKHSLASTGTLRTLLVLTVARRDSLAFTLKADITGRREVIGGW